MKKSEIEKLIRIAFLEEFQPIGFKGKTSNASFTRTTASGKIQISVSANTLGQFPAIEYYVGLQVNEVEDFINGITPPDPNLKHDFFYTLNFPWYVFLRDNHETPSPFQRNEIKGDDYIPLITKGFFQLFSEKIEPFLSMNSEVSNLSLLLNREPIADSPYTTQKVERAIRGLVSGHLSSPQETPHLISLYKDYLQIVLPQLKLKFESICQKLSS